jgi:hypothetical protein
MLISFIVFLVAWRTTTWRDHRIDHAADAVNFDADLSPMEGRDLPRRMGKIGPSLLRVGDQRV